MFGILWVGDEGRFNFEEHTIMDRTDVLAKLDYFMEWGGRSWRDLCRYALSQVGNLQGKEVLEIGPRFGKLSVMFALLGAKVVGLETSPKYLKVAEQEIRKWEVQQNVELLTYNGDLDSCTTIQGRKFDIIFTKSVLVLLGDNFSEYLKKLETKLSPRGQCVFLENRKGNPIFLLLRMMRPSSRKHYKHVSYLTDSHLKIIDEIYSITEVRKTIFPPIYLILAKKRS